MQIISVNKNKSDKPGVKPTLHKPPLKKRALGKFKGKIWTSPDFDDESDEINEMFYGGSIEP